MNDGTCERPQCKGIPLVGSQWCWEHYARWLLTGTPDGEPTTFKYPPRKPGEKWLPVVGYEENYLVSNRGRIWSRPRHKTPGGIMKLQRHPFGYWQVGLTATDGSQQTHKVHFLVVRAFEGPRPEWAQLIRHLNGDPGDNRWPENITWGTYPENGEDMVRHGRSALRKTHCPQGHPYDEENTRYGSKGERICKICYRASMRAGQKRYRERLRAEGKQCSVEGCEDIPVGRGLCDRHYKQVRKAEKATELSATG